MFICAETGSATSSIRGDDARALLVEDEPDFLALLGHHLRALGFACTEAPDAEDAQSVVHETDFDLVIVDMVLPGLSGAEFINWLRAQAGGWDAAVVAVSILDPPKTTWDLADVVLTKPFRRAELVGAVRQARIARDERTDAR